jgi:hypothetical protein
VATTYLNPLTNACLKEAASCPTDYFADSTKNECVPCASVGGTTSTADKLACNCPAPYFWTGGMCDFI